MKKRTYRLAVLVSHVIQYLSPLFRALASAEDLDVKVYFCSERGVRPELDSGFGKVISWDVPLLDGYPHVFLKNLSPSALREGLFGYVNPGIIRELMAERHDALLVFGWAHVSSWLGFLGARLSRTPFLLVGDSNPLRRRPWMVEKTRSAKLRLLFSLAAGGLPVGKKNEEFYRRYSRSIRLFRFPFAVDNEFFQRARIQDPSRILAIRRELGLDERPVVLYCGKLLPHKRPCDLLEAFSLLRPGSAQLLFVGDGPEREPLEAAARERKLGGVVFAGFVNQSELPRHYSISDVFVLPSADEPWGLVLNEVMNFGLPVLVSDRCGCAYDLVDGNGETFSPGDAETLSRLIQKVVDDAELRQRWGRRSLEIIGQWSFASDVEAIRKALSVICK